LHDEDLEVDTEFCAMCGHDWCSLRISKEITEFASGKDADFQPARPAMRSPGVGEEGRALLRQRGTLPVVEGKHACHSDLVTEAVTAQEVQTRALADASQ
jgi:phosphomethylpyrimidine synthase